jgi:hypothetical protein
LSKQEVFEQTKTERDGIKNYIESQNIKFFLDKGEVRGMGGYRL